eukprot:jgi/Mesvir1/4928/Mv11262-RA.1
MPTPHPHPFHPPTPAQVLQWIRSINRPVNVQNGADALQKYAINKAAVQRALDSLAEQGHVAFKDYGKQRIYVARQDTIQVASAEVGVEVELLLLVTIATGGWLGCAKEMEAIRKEVDTLLVRVNEEKAAVAGLQAEVNTMESSLTEEQLAARISELEEKTSSQDKRLQALRSGNAPIVRPQDRAEAVARFNRVAQLWRQRKRAFKDLFETLTESLDVPRARLMEEIGIETDESARVDINVYTTMLAPPPKRQK